MKETKDVVCCVVDRGTFFPVAERLARGFKKVYSCIPNGESFETVGRDSLGFGVPGVEAVREFWPIKDEIDLFVFPDSRDWGLQQALESQGFAVWGSKRGEELETLRGYWLEVAKEIGLPMPHTEVVRGLENMRTYLHEHRGEKKFIKMSRYRGDMETWCADDWMATRKELDSLATLWGPLQDTLTFYIQDDLNTEIEGGADSYFVAGGFPDEVIIGYEKKDLGYFGAVMKQADMPPEIWTPSQLVTPVLAQSGYCNFFSTEVRVLDAKSYLLDPCCRCPSPAGEEQLEMYENFPDIVWQGANGIMVQPKWAAKYCGELVINWTGDGEGVKSLRVPEGVRQWVKLFACACVDEAFHFPPNHPNTLGCVVGIGDTPGEVLDHLKEIRAELEGQPVELRVEPFAEIITEINQAKEEGMEFGEGHELPEPAAVLDE